MQFFPYRQFHQSVLSVLNMCIILPLVIYYFKYFGKILPVLSTSINEFKMKNVLEWMWADTPILPSWQKAEYYKVENGDVSEGASLGPHFPF